MKFRKIVAALLSMVIITTIAAAPLSVQAAEIDSGVDVGTTPSVRATNSFGSLLSNKLETYMSDDKEPSEYVITYASVENNIATVVYSAPEDCKIVAAVYDENTGEMLASGNAKASAAEDIAQLDVVIDTDSMPKYFNLKVFILDNDNNPLNDCYSTNYYTSGIQEVVNSTVDDFNSEKVFNLDDDKETNFVVYSENTTLVDYTEGHNIPNTTYSETGVYVFSKANDDIKNLKKGDNVAYKYNDEVILFKVKDIKINGDTVTVTEDENADMEEFFDCIKIDSKSSPDNVTYDRSTADEGVEFEGFVEDEDSKAPQPSSAASDTFSGDLVNLKFKIKEKTLFDFNPQEGNNLKVKVEADVLLKVGYYLQYFYKSDISDSYIRFNLDASLSLSGTLDANITLEKALGSVGWSPVFGVYIGAEPTLKGSVDFSTTGSISVSKLFAVERQTDGTVKDVSTAAKANSELKATGELYIGIDLNPKVSVINEKI